MPTFRYVSDQNQDVLLLESGAYASSTGIGQWIGQVTAHEVDEQEGYITVRHTGGLDRNVDQFTLGPRTVVGTITFNVQDWRMLRYALGGYADSGSPSPYLHTFTEANNNNSDQDTGEVFPSFTLEASQQTLIAGSGLNFIRTMNGCMVDSMTIAADEGGIVSTDVSYIAQSSAFSSGAVTAVTVSTEEPFKWNHGTIDLPSGTQLNTIKSMSITINNNLQAPNYTDGTRDIGVPIPTERDYEVSLTIDTDSASPGIKTLHETYFRGGSTFNMLFNFTASTGSRVLNATFSGCIIETMPSPQQAEGNNETTLTIKPQSMSAIEDGLIEKYDTP